MKFVPQLFLFLFLAALTAGCGGNRPSSKTGEPAGAGAKKEFTMAWSIYAGWQPWDYADRSGILKKWADKYGLHIKLVKMDYVPSIEAYVSGQADACVMTNIEALDMPAAAGVASTAVVLGDFSNGNDALLVRDNLSLADLAGKQVSLVQYSVSHYLLSRALEKSGLKESDVTILNTSDSDIAPAFMANNDQKAVVTWNPMVLDIKRQPGIKSLFSSASIPGEVLDLLVVNSKVLQANTAFAKALTGAWYEVMAVMKKEDAAADKALTVMAESAGCPLEVYKEQLKTTALFYTPNSALNYVKSKEIMKSMDYVRKFCFNHGLLGEKATSYDELGIAYPGGQVQGDAQNVQLTFDPTYMEMAAKTAL
ncbi:putative urea ABC transporter substrate-binding protein [Paraflavisolibacter sp. H34]|uniref:putative urea ABC transporter substrate-binding protein n=1 Tax=Huijunlia imazamoxiresistens TaxID=3127457 RepID=UPI00301B1A76